jgi:DNA-binding response OmpR family regulator
MEIVPQPASLLVIADDAELAALLANYFHQEAYRVVQAAEASQALAFIRNKHPDLILIDAAVAADGAITLCRMVRKSTPAPLILLTSGENEFERILGLDMGADLCLVKPPALGELRARIRALLRRAGQKAAQRHQSYTAGHLRLDTERRRAWAGERELRLTTREFDLLAYLMRNRGMVLPRTLLLREVWGETVPDHSRTLEVHIRWLRQKVEPDPAQPIYIQTVRPIGYRFDAP